jgi:hypothetical protein
MSSILIHPDLVANITKQLPEDVTKLLQHIGSGICVAGGFCRDAFLGESPKDVDIFGTSEKVIRETIEWFSWNNTEYEPEVITANSRTFKPKYDHEVQPVQFVTRSWYPTHAELIESFDWSVCQCAVFWSQLSEKFEGICTKGFGEDIQAGKLHYTAPERDEDPGASILRMVKLTHRGFKPTEESIARAIGRFAAELVKQETHLDDAFDKDMAPVTKEIEYSRKAKRCFRSCGYSWKHGRKGQDDVSGD